MSEHGSSVVERPAAVSNVGLQSEEPFAFKARTVDLIDELRGIGDYEANALAEPFSFKARTVDLIDELRGIGDYEANMHTTENAR